VSEALPNIATAGGAGRLLTFEVDAHIYALPIGGILEVAEAGTICGVPTLPRALAGVMNWHGEALPIVATRLIVTRPEEVAVDAPPVDPATVVIEDESADLAAEIFGAHGAAPLSATHVLVISDRSGEAARLGLPIDSVIGLVDGSGRSYVEVGLQVVVERRSIDGRVVSVLDPRRLLARANHVIERLAA
jgi:chemotaxis signal transduction protein